MEHTEKHKAGVFLSEQDRAALTKERKNRLRRRKQKKLWLILGLTVGNALLVYMIAKEHIDPCYGAAFAATASTYFGYQLKGV